MQQKNMLNFMFRLYCKINTFCNNVMLVFDCHTLGQPKTILDSIIPTNTPSPHHNPPTKHHTTTTPPTHRPGCGYI